MMRHVVIFLVYTIALWSADATIDIIKKVSSDPRVAIESYASSPQKNTLMKKIEKMIRADLEVAASFHVSDVAFPKELEAPINYLLYKDHDVDYVVRIKDFGEYGRIGLFVSIYDVMNEKHVFRKKYTVSLDERYPFLAHKFTSDFVKFLGFGDVAWMQKFIIFSRYTGPKQSEIVLGDYSLTYQQVIVKNGLSLFPKWKSAKQRTFYYTDMTGKPTLYEVDLYSGVRNKVMSSDGMLVCSDVSEDGTELLLTVGENDQPDIYKYNLDTGSMVRITTHKGIDVNGNFINGDRDVVFVSDRLGKPNIFLKESGRSGVSQFIYRGDNNNYCNAHGDYVAYVSRDTQSEFSNNRFNIYLASTKTDYLRQLTTTGKNLYPRFAPTGDTILYIKYLQNDTSLGVIRLEQNKNFLFPLKVGKLQSIDW